MKQVSVIIPNYNYAHFLVRRINSVINQTVKPAEIIFMDDCSTDSSLVVAKEILQNTNIPYQIIANETNQGVFKQWLKGIELVQHEYFWIAEADDYCELNFLETLLSSFDDEQVVMTYCDSNIINNNRQVVYDDKAYKGELFNTERWLYNFVADGVSEVADYYAAINISPNVSAILFRKDQKIIDSVKSISTFKKIGDWLFYIIYLTTLPKCKIAYNHLKLNYHLRHSFSTWTESRNSKEPTILLESLKIYHYVLKNYVIKEPVKERIANFITDWLEWYRCNNEVQTWLIKIMPHLDSFPLICLLKAKYEKQLKETDSFYWWIKQPTRKLKALLRQLLKIK